MCITTTDTFFELLARSNSRKGIKRQVKRLFLILVGSVNVKKVEKSCLKRLDTHYLMCVLINCFKQVLIKEEEMKRIFSTYIIFAFLLTSFAGCGKLKNSPVSGLNQSKAPAPPEVNSQSETSTLPETVSQPDISSEVETINPPVSSLPPAHYRERIAEPDEEGQPRREISSSDKFACALVAGVPILLAWGITAAWNAYEEYCFRNSDNLIREFYEQRWREREMASRSRQR